MTPSGTQNTTTCPQCPNKSFPNQTSLEQKFLLEHNQAEPTIPICAIKLENQYDYETEQSQKTDYGSSSIGSPLVSNFQTYQREERHPCDSCSQFFTSKALLDNHRQFLCGVVKCPQCPKLSFSDQTELVQHISLEHSQSKSQILNCDDNIMHSLRSKLQGKLPVYDCKRCKTEFKTKSELDSHTKWCFTCEVCSKVFKTQGGLAYHLRIHQGGQARCVCDLCGLSVIKQNLKQHREVVHEGKKPNRKRLKCVICGASCVGKTQLHQHMMTHTGEKQYKCDICHRECIQKGNFLRHKCKPPLQ